MEIEESISESTRDLRERLARARQLAAQREFACALAHDLNQPLCAIVSRAQACGRILQPRPEGAGLGPELDRIAQDGLRSAELLTRIRDQLGREEAVRRPIDLGQQIADVADLYVAMKPGIRLELSGLSWPIVGDPIQLQVLMANLIENALEAACESTSPRPIVVRTTTSTEGTVVEVIDHGPGLAAEHLAELFVPFFTTRRNRAGLGLAVCHTVAQAHGASLDAETPEGGGTVFRLTLPREEDPRT